ncbi:hypothetical protein MGYG_08224 [Nannizzia gypsea CBS 118893]|uniref:Uncharacterized protein n=1 Tax=Arthroderma gypseum (strain ATCC MYA-4604 / CBS 118893) TaxID=535722 RepID=E4V5D6_ARTGP|nr:hypothetical protein MGYG_08224 [Nannizzia gypsea CBS 118893]EFR05210.1 hypothetical protein MGYG_08224 [Nannizzia gypsea CBS 118893]
MYRGLAASSRTNNAYTNIMTLETATGRALRRIKARRRRDARYTGSRRIRYPPGYSCDELQESLNSSQLKRGGQFRIKIKGLDYLKFSRSIKSPILKSDSNLTVLSSKIFRNYSDRNNALLIPVTTNDSISGQYKIDYTLAKGSLISGAVIDSEGEKLTTISSLTASSSGSTSFKLDEEDLGDMTLLGWINNTGDIQLNYTVSLPQSQPSSSPGRTSRPTASAPAASGAVRPSVIS